MRNPHLLVNAAVPGRIAAIDGLRGVAVVLVMIYHFDIGLPGGFIGVDLFFTISGFVVVRRLLHQFAQSTSSNTSSTGNTSNTSNTSNTTKALLKNFYLGRFWRLFPALAVMVVVVIGLSLLMSPTLGSPSRNVGHGFSAFAGLANWFRLLHPDQLGEVARPLLHTWSLSIEEQFYVCIPLALAVFRRRARAAAYVLGGLCVAVSALPLPSRDPTERYFFTLGRLAPLGFGVVLAAFLDRPFANKTLGNPGKKELNNNSDNNSDNVTRSNDSLNDSSSLDPRHPQHQPTPNPQHQPSNQLQQRAESSSSQTKLRIKATDLVFGVIALLLLPTLRWSTWNARSLFPFGLGLLGLLAAGLLGLLTLDRTGVVSAALESRPAQYLGSRSYSLYLWHFPLAHLFMSQPRLVRTLAWVLLSFLAAELSYRLVEQPLRRFGPTPSTEVSLTSAGMTSVASRNSARLSQRIPLAFTSCFFLIGVLALLKK